MVVIISKMGVLLPDALPHWNKLTLETIELDDEPIVLFADVLCNIANSCMSRTTTNPKKRCKPWFNTECKDAMKAKKAAVDHLKTNITSENLSNFRIARAKTRIACCEINVPVGNIM